MHVLAQQEGLGGTALQIRPDRLRRGVHPALHVGDPVIGPAVVHALIVLVPLEHAPGPVHHALPPLRQAPGHVPGRVYAVPLLPGPVALQIGLVHHVDPVLIAQLVPRRLVGVVAGAHRVDVVAEEHHHGRVHVRLTDGPAGLRAPLVAVHPPEHQPLPVEQDHAVPYLQAAEAGLAGRHLHDPPPGAERQRHLVQRRGLVAPGEDVLKPEALAAEVPALRLQDQRPVKENALVRMGHPAGDRRALRLPAQQQPEGQNAVRALQPRLQPQVLQVDRRLGVEEHGAEDAAEPEEVLVLDPGRAGALEDLRAQPVAGGTDIGGEVKVRGGEAVLGVAHKMAVEPEEEGLLHPLETDAHPFPPQGGVQVKGPDVAAHRVVLPVDLGGQQLGVAVPGVEAVDVLDLAIALQFHMARHKNGPKGGVVKILPPERRRAGCGGPAPGEPPHPVQGLAQGGLAPGRLLGGGAAHVVRVGVQPVHLEHGWVGQPLQICLHSASPCLMGNLLTGIPGFLLFRLLCGHAAKEAVGCPLDSFPLYQKFLQ